MENIEIEKAKVFRLAEEIEYVPHSVISRTIYKKPTGFIKAFSFDSGEGMAETVSQFDTICQVIDGKAEIIIDGKSNILETGQFVIIPAHIHNSIKATGRFKMISTVIKSGYE